jgi:C_GCAxxG_C_C family probable redox protein
MGDRADTAGAAFKEGFNCAQAVLLAYAGDFGLSHDDAARVAGGFGGGMGRSGATCGAVTGGIMALGLKYGAIKGPDVASKGKTYTYVREFMRQFKERMGSVICRDLVGYDISTTEGHDAAARTGVFQTTCPKAIGVAADILEGML